MGAYCTYEPGVSIVAIYTAWAQKYTEIQIYVLAHTAKHIN